MVRKVCITAVDGQTGHLVAELLLTDPQFSNAVNEVVGLSINPHHENCEDLVKKGGKVILHEPGRMKKMIQTLKDTGADTICLIPPTHKNKYHITEELVEAAKRAEIQNVCMISSAGCDMAEKEKQPRLREFLALEMLVLETKGDTSTPTGHSPVVIRPGFYAENLLLYAPQMQKDKTIPLPCGTKHKFAPVALGDVALVAAHVLSSKGKHGFSDKVRGQLITLTGPMLASGNELATAASEALGTTIEFEHISEAEAKHILQSQGDQDDSELQYILEYYSLVREGKTNYISTCAFNNITDQHPQELVDFFKVYGDTFMTDGHVERKMKKRKLNGH